MPRRPDFAARAALAILALALAAGMPGRAQAQPARGAAAPPAAGAKPPVRAPDADQVKAFRQVIRAQLDAFRRDDAKRAFGHASAGIQARFGTPEAFLAMVRSDYAVVYRPRTVEFLDPLVREGELLQPVQMSDDAGAQWIALYALERQAGGGWRISGCSLHPIPGRAT